jgi:hypothetical protein
VIRLLLAAWITVVVVVLCATRRWWGLVFVVPLVLDFVLAPPDLGGRLRLIARRQRSSGSSQAAGRDTVAPTIRRRTHPLSTDRAYGSRPRVAIDPFAEDSHSPGLFEQLP